MDCTKIQRVKGPVQYDLAFTQHLLATRESHEPFNSIRYLGSPQRCHVHRISSDNRCLSLASYPIYQSIHPMEFIRVRRKTQQPMALVCINPWSTSFSLIQPKKITGDCFFLLYSIEPLASLCSMATSHEARGRLIA